MAISLQSLLLVFLKVHVASWVALVVKNLPADAGDARDSALIPALGSRSPGVDPVFLPGKSHGQKGA